MTDGTRAICHGFQLLVIRYYVIVGKDFRRQFTLNIYRSCSMGQSKNLKDILSYEY